jgi:hypothetical protein
MPAYAPDTYRTVSLGARLSHERSSNCSPPSPPGVARRKANAGRSSTDQGKPIDASHCATEEVISFPLAQGSGGGDSGCEKLLM